MLFRSRVSILSESPVLCRKSPLLVYLLEFVGRYAWLKLGWEPYVSESWDLAPRHERHLWLGIVALGSGEWGWRWWDRVERIHSSSSTSRRCLAHMHGSWTWSHMSQILARRHERHLWLGAVACVDVSEIVGVAGIAVMAIEAKLQVQSFKLDTGYIVDH